MFDTSKDILYLVISFCILWLTVFLCWAIYHFGKVLKNANEVVEEFRGRMDAITDAIDFIHHKIDQLSGAMTVATSGVGGLVKKMASKKAENFFESATGNMNGVAKAAVKKATKAMVKKTKANTKKIAKKKIVKKKKK